VICLRYPLWLSYLSIIINIDHAQRSQPKGSASQQPRYFCPSPDQLYYFEMEEINPKRIKYQSGRQSSHHKYQKLPGNEADKRAQLKKSPSGELT